MNSFVGRWYRGHAQPHSRTAVTVDVSHPEVTRTPDAVRPRRARRLVTRRHVPAGLQERLGGREDLGERGVAGDGHRVVEAELSPEPPTRNTQHVSNSRAHTSHAVCGSGPTTELNAQVGCVSATATPE